MAKGCHLTGVAHADGVEGQFFAVDSSIVVALLHRLGVARKGADLKHKPSAAVGVEEAPVLGRRRLQPHQGVQRLLDIQRYCLKTTTTGASGISLIDCLLTVCTCMGAVCKERKISAAMATPTAGRTHLLCHA